jgi:glycosyltransferase involved in cell wall biosynthesis
VSRPRICRIVSVAFVMRTQLKAQLRHAADAGLDVTMVCSPSADLTALGEELGIRSHGLDIARQPSPVQDLVSLAALTRFFARERFDLVHSSTPKAGLLCALAGLASRTPLRLHTYTGQPWVELQGVSRWVPRQADRLIAGLDTHLYADSHSQRAFLVDEGIVRADRISVIGHGSIAGVELARFDRARWVDAGRAIRARLQIPPESCVIAFVGRLTRDKGICELVAAFERVSRRPGRVDLLLVGPEEPERAPLPAHVAAAIGSNAGIHAVGYSAEPERYLAAADLFCLPSYREGFGSVVIEAGAMGLPSVATRVTGLQDTVVDGETGVLVPAKDVDALVAALERLVADPALRHRMGEAGHRRALAQFDATIVNGQMVDEYKKWLGMSR